VNPCGDVECKSGDQGFAYGLSYLFARYLEDRFGQAFIGQVIRSYDNTVSGIDRALRREDPALSFQRVYSDFMVAVYTSGTQLQVEPRYRFSPEINLRATYGDLALSGPRGIRVQSLGQIQAVSLHTWGTAFFELGQDDARAWSLAFENSAPLFGSAIGW